jgi:monothiol glutaredoxin
MSLDENTRDQINALIESNPVLLFMKGNRGQPQCGFSATVVKILDAYLPSYETFDVLSDGGVREGIKDFSSWPTIPQLYIQGEFIGGCDIIKEIDGTGELAAKLGLELDQVAAPELELSDAAAQALTQATAGAPEDQGLHLGVDARYRSSLFMAPIEPDSLAVETNGFTIHVDRLSAGRAREARIDVADTPNGPGFQVQLPHAPQRVQQLSVKDLKSRLDAGEAFEFIDVRTPEERATASIPGSTLINEIVAGRLEALPKETVLVFHCHHGGRSQSAAEHFADLGFSNVFNVIGGIDAWSQEVAPEVPRY